MISKKQIYRAFFITKYNLLVLVIIGSCIIAQENIDETTVQDSVSNSINDSLEIALPANINIIEERFTISGKAAYGNGVLVPDAEVMLLDTLEKTLDDIITFSV